MHVLIIHIGSYLVSSNGGTQQWLLYNGQAHGMDDDWGKPYFRKPPYTYIHMLVGGFNPSEKYERQLG